MQRIWAHVHSHSMLVCSELHRRRNKSKRWRCSRSLFRSPWCCCCCHSWLMASWGWWWCLCFSLVRKWFVINWETPFQFNVNFSVEISSVSAPPLFYTSAHHEVSVIIYLFVALDVLFKSQNYNYSKICKILQTFFSFWWWQQTSLEWRSNGSILRLCLLELSLRADDWRRDIKFCDFPFTNSRINSESNSISLLNGNVSVSLSAAL